MKKVAKIIVVLIALIILLWVIYKALDVLNSRPEIITTDTGLEPIGSLQVMSEAKAQQQDAYFKVELPSTKVPFVSINVVDVSSENYEKAVDNIELQQAVMTVFMHKRYSEPFHFSVQDYGDSKRILWINEFDEPYFNKLYELEEAQGREGPDGWDYLWMEFARLTNGYLWWGSPLDSSGDFQTGIEEPYSILPENRPSLPNMLKEMQAMTGSYYSVSVFEVNESQYEQVHLKIQSIQSNLHRTLGDDSYKVPFHYSTQQYGKTIRITWINRFIDDQYEGVRSVYSVGELWQSLDIESFFWWASQEIEKDQQPRVSLVTKIDMLLRMFQLVK